MNRNLLRRWPWRIVSCSLGSTNRKKFPSLSVCRLNRVVDAINGLGERRAVVIERAEDIAFYVAQNAVPGDIVIVMSNGGFDGVQDKILQALAG